MVIYFIDILLIFGIFYFLFQFIPLSIANILYSTLSPQIRAVLLAIMSLSFLSLFVFQMILSRGPGGVMYYAYVVNLICAFYVFTMSAPMFRPYASSLSQFFNYNDAHTSRPSDACINTYRVYPV